MSARRTTKAAPRDTLNRERVLRAAMELADESGIEGLSMRKLGRRLGVEAASLYNHVSDKDDLLDEMADLVAAEIGVPADDADWKEAMRRRACSARDTFLRHPWAIGVMDSRRQMGPALLAYADGVLGTLLRAGFTPREAANAWLTIDSYIYGFVRQTGTLAVREEVDTVEIAEEIIEALPAETYPSMMLIAEDFARAPHDEAAVFEFGLGLILDGLERSLGVG